MVQGVLWVVQSVWSVLDINEDVAMSNGVLLA